MSNKKSKKNILSSKNIRNLVMARLSVLSPEIMISLGSEGSFTRDNLIESVERGDRVGQKIAEVELAWLRSFKDNISYEVNCN